MKKLLSLFAIATLFVFLVSCTPGVGNAPAEETEDQPNELITYNVVYEDIDE